MDTTKVLDFLKTEDGRKLLQPRLDRHFSKGLGTWKTNSLLKLIQEHEAKKMSETERLEKRLKELSQQLDLKKQVKALKMKCDETGLDAFTPIDELVNVLATLDNEQAVRTIESLAEHFNTIFHDLLSKEVNTRFEGIACAPRYKGVGVVSNGSLTKSDILKMPYEERAKFFQQNPDHYRFIMNG